MPVGSGAVSKMLVTRSCPREVARGARRHDLQKGDVADCGNYRPISLLQIGYKLFASILLQRLIKGGADGRIWSTQFGFRPGRGTMDAVFLTRRIVEEANALQDKRLVLLALDWAKAFDSISPYALCRSLRRFGLPTKFLQCIQGIRANRCFFFQFLTAAGNQACTIRATV